MALRLAISAVIWLLLSLCESGIASGTDCDFEQDQCQWMNGDYYWTRVLASNVSFLIKDHTRGDEKGHYLVVKSSHQMNGSSAQLYSEVLQGSTESPYCFSFFYFLMGDDMGQLKVIIRDNSYYDTAHIDHDLWALTGPGPDEWEPAKVNISTVYFKENFTIILEAMFGSGPNGVIAVDDIQLNMTDCSTYPPKADISGNSNSPSTTSSAVSTGNTENNTIISSTSPYTTTTKGKVVDTVTPSSDIDTWKIAVGAGVGGFLVITLIVTGILLYLRHTGKICVRSFALTFADMTINHRVSDPPPDDFNNRLSGITLLECRPTSTGEVNEWRNSKGTMGFPAGSL